MSDNSTVYTNDFNIEQVWAMFRETNKKIQETTNKIQETSNNIEKLQAKYDAIFEREAEARRKEHEEYEKRREEDEKRYEEKVEKWREEYEESRKLSEESARKRDQVVKRVSRSIGDLGNRFGELAEHLVAPGIADRFDELGYHFNGIATNGFLFKEDKRVIAQVDVLLENTTTIAIVEIKTKPKISDIETHIKRIETIRQYLKRQPALSYKNDKELIGAIAGAIFPDEVKKATIESGFYVITQSGDTLKIEVPEDFKPRKF